MSQFRLRCGRLDRIRVLRNAIREKGGVGIQQCTISMILLIQNRAHSTFI